MPIFVGHAAIYEKRTYLLVLCRAVLSIEVFRYNFQWIIQCLSLQMTSQVWEIYFSKSVMLLKELTVRQGHLRKVCRGQILR